MSATLERGQHRPVTNPPSMLDHRPTRQPIIPDGFFLRTPYDPYFVEELKRLPTDDRCWTGDVWWVAGRHEATVLERVVFYFDSVTIINPGGASDEIVDRHGRSIQERLL